MLALRCNKCGSTNLEPGRYHDEYKCVDCGSILQLYQITIVRIPTGAGQTNPQKMREELMGASTVAQIA